MESEPVWWRLGLYDEETWRSILFARVTTTGRREPSMSPLDTWDSGTSKTTVRFYCWFEDLYLSDRAAGIGPSKRLPKVTAVMMLLQGSIVPTDKAETYLQSIRSRVLESEQVHGSVTTDFVRRNVQQDRGIGFFVTLHIPNALSRPTH